jgi:hypothetical protein
MVQYTVRRLIKKRKCGRIVIAMLGADNDVNMPANAETMTVIGDFASVVDCIAKTATDSPSTAPAALIEQASA